MGIPNEIIYTRFFKYYIFALCILFMQSFVVWVFWGELFKVVIPVSFMLISLMNRRINSECYSNNINYLVVFFLFLAMMIGVRDSGVLSILKKLVLLFAFYDILSLKEDVKSFLLDIITKVVGCITAISLIGWLLFLLNIPLPYYELEDPVYGYSFHNYFLFLHSHNLMFPRFHSVFLEPGHFAMIAAPLVYANGFNLKNKYVLSLFIGIIFSTSIAGYFVLMMSLFFLFGGKKVIIISVIIATLFACGVDYYSRHDEETNALYHLIFRRLQFEDGDLVANDRFSEDFDEFYSEKFTKSNDRFFGLAGQTQKMKWDGGNAGYKLFIVEYGYVGLALVFLIYYFIMIQSNVSPKLRLGYFLIYVALFLQASYPLWFGVFFLYVVGLAKLKSVPLGVEQNDNNPT